MKENEDYSITIDFNVNDIKDCAADAGMEVTTDEAIDILKNMEIGYASWESIDPYLNDLRLAKKNN